MTATVRFEDGRVWVLPGYASESAAAPASCKSCGAPILWVKTTKGRQAPINQDGTSHFSDCPQAAKWRSRDTTAGG